jgi:hypothetical protein
MRENVLDHRVIQRQAQGIHEEPSIIRLPAEPSATRAH